mgnify:CR=1 FL=1
MLFNKLANNPYKITEYKEKIICKSTKQFFSYSNVLLISLYSILILCDIFI